MIEILRRMQEEEQNLGWCFDFVCIHTRSECACTVEELKDRQINSNCNATCVF